MPSEERQRWGVVWKKRSLMTVMGGGRELSGLERYSRDTRDETGDKKEEGREENREGKWQQSDGRRFSQNPNPGPEGRRTPTCALATLFLIEPSVGPEISPCRGTLARRVEDDGGWPSQAWHEATDRTTCSC